MNGMGLLWSLDWLITLIWPDVSNKDSRICRRGDEPWRWIQQNLEDDVTVKVSSHCDSGGGKKSQNVSTETRYLYSESSWWACWCALLMAQNNSAISPLTASGWVDFTRSQAFGPGPPSTRKLLEG